MSNNPALKRSGILEEPVAGVALATAYALLTLSWLSAPEEAVWEYRVYILPLPLSCFEQTFDSASNGAVGIFSQ